MTAANPPPTSSSPEPAQAEPSLAAPRRQATPDDTPPGDSPPGDPALLAHVAGLRARLAPRLVPDFDPRDGGTAARVLLLLEKPGPAAARSGLVSRDNDSPTGAALRRFLAEAGLPRGETAIWNLIPAWNGTIRVTPREEREGRALLPATLALFPRLDAVILVGARAGRAAGLLPAGLLVVRSAHPSPQVRAAFPDRWAAIPRLWAAAAR